MTIRLPLLQEPIRSLIKTVVVGGETVHGPPFFPSGLLQCIDR